ncbi:MAG: hypothetical protein EOO04_04145 [Chitinophagaceae bacterium]|nr:MAG: hypothetical protein EOO04_04145 [Chitinophagaceae bacterium]
MKQLICLLVLTGFLSCVREITNQPDTSPSFVLKSIVIHGLPSPYYHFAYSPNGRPPGFAHERDIYQYRVQYEAGRVFRVIDTATLSRDTLTYHYNENLVNWIDIANARERKVRHVLLEYDQQTRLTRVRWIDDGSGEEKKRLVLRYTGNNMTALELFVSVSGTLISLSAYSYLQFDDKENPFPNSMLKDDHFLFLPGVRLQVNNPVSYVITGVSNDFRVTDTYNYQGAVPVTKTSVMEQTRGPETGKRVTSITEYNYY